MDISNLIIGIILTSIGGVSAVQTGRLIFTPLKKIAFAKGNSTIVGTVVIKDALFSPITKTPCVYCAFRTFQRGAEFSETRGTAQVMAGSGVKHSDFFLEDDSGKIYVKNIAQLFGDSKKQITVYDDTEEYQKSIQEFKLITKIGEGEDRQYEEDVITEGDIIYIHGVVKIENGQKIMYPDAFSFKTIKKIGSSPIGIIITIVLLVLGVNLLWNSF